MSLLETTAVSKRFGGLTAVNEVDLKLGQNEILAVIGPNGAGKTTFFNCITGVLPVTSGKVMFDGMDITDEKPWTIARLGISRTYQNIRLFGKATVLDNVRIGHHKHIRSGFWASLLKTPAMRAEERAITERCREILEFVGLTHNLTDLAENLSYGDQRRLEIARVLAMKPKVVLLDEPTAGMNPDETLRTCALIESIRDMGVSILIIEHDMNVVMGISDRIVVLNYGAKIAEGTPEEIRGNEQVIEAYLGKEGE
ncbi:MAG: ABC transporter ATP-binding protein [Firmicutes bacterium]|jgi:branched-chain amino acid transport system ATP-binding protein|nr:ABC transporter ATP-binding protein [Bacillota bacterium]